MHESQPQDAPENLNCAADPNTAEGCANNFINNQRIMASDDGDDSESAREAPLAQPNRYL